MKRFKKSLSILLVLVFTFSTLIMPVVVQAAPIASPLTLPTIPNISPPSIPTAPGVSLSDFRQLETPSTITGVNYRFNPNIINMPDMSYSLRDIPKSTLEGGETGIAPPISTQGGVVAPGLTTPQAGQELPYNAKNLVIKPGSFLTPKLGDVYFDPKTNASFKVAGNASVDASGNQMIPVVEPCIDEVLQQFNVPEQTIPLTSGNIDFDNLPQGVEYMGVEGEKSGSIPGSYVASNVPLPYGTSFSREGNTYIFKIKDFTIYPPQDNKTSGKGDKESGDKEESKEKGKSGGGKDNPWTGVEDKSKFGVTIKISEGTIRVTDPKIRFKADWDTLINPLAEVNCEVDMDIDADVTIEGDINFKKEIWQQIYGYLVCDNQSDPKVKVYIGIFAFIDLHGELSFRIKVTQVGHLNHGLDLYPATLALGTPIIVPYGDFDSYKRGVGIIIDGDITAAAGVMAGLGIEIFEFKVVQLQIRLGLEGNCTFKILLGDTEGMEGGDRLPGGENATATFKLYFLAYVDVAGIGFQKRLVEFKPLLVDKTWSGTIGPEGGAGAGEGVEKIIGRADIFIDKVDAFENVVEGHVLVGDMPDQRPYVGPVSIHVNSYDFMGKNTGYNVHTVTTDSKGEFRLFVPLSPFDKVKASLRMETDMSIYKGTTEYMETTVPFSLIEFEADAFNDKVYGTVSGGYTGDLLIFVNRPGKPTGMYSTRATMGKFSEPIDLIGGDVANILLNFENKDIWAYSIYDDSKWKAANIDALDIGVSLDSLNTIKGTIQNTEGDTPYTGDVEILVNERLGLATDYIVIKAYEGTTEALPLVKQGDFQISFLDRMQGKITGPQAPASMGGATPEDIYKDLKSCSGYSFDNTPIPQTNMDFYLTIEHDGIEKTYKKNAEEKEPFFWETHGFGEVVVSPTAQRVDPIINPVDSMMQGVMNDVNVPMNVIYQCEQQAAVRSNMPVYKSKLKAASGNGFVNLEWNPVHSINVAGYNIYRGTSAGNYDKAPLTSTPINDINYTDNNVKNGTKYYYIVKTVFKDGTESEPSNKVMAAPATSIKTPVKPPSITPNLPLPLKQ